MLMAANRTFPASRARALPRIANDPEVRLRDIAASWGITEHSAYGDVTDLAEAGTGAQLAVCSPNRCAHCPLRVVLCLERPAA